MKKIGDVVKMPQNLAQTKKESIDELCQDARIKAFMQKEGLTRPMMDDYWIELINYQEDYIQCLNCPGLDRCPKNTKGYQMLLHFNGDHLALDMTPCNKQEDYMAKLEALRLIEPCNMPKSLFDLKLEDVDLQGRKDVLLACRKIISSLSSKGLFLYGPMQNGKTTIMASLIYKFASKGIPCAFINVPTLIVELKEQFSQDNKSNILNELKSVDILVLDDIGGENVTAWSRDEVLNSILSERALRKLPTFFTSVYSFDELKQYYVLTKQKGDTIKVERLVEKMKAVSVPIELKSGKYNS